MVVFSERRVHGLLPAALLYRRRRGALTLPRQNVPTSVCSSFRVGGGEFECVCTHVAVCRVCVCEYVCTCVK